MAPGRCRRLPRCPARFEYGERRTAAGADGDQRRPTAPRARRRPRFPVVASQPQSPETVQRRSAPDAERASSGVGIPGRRRFPSSARRSSTSHPQCWLAREGQRPSRGIPRHGSSHTRKPRPSRGRIAVDGPGHVVAQPAVSTRWWRRSSRTTCGASARDLSMVLIIGTSTEAVEIRGTQMRSHPPSRTIRREPSIRR
jgi:hypothetical protein